jgi:hypothetical protein
MARIDFVIGNDSHHVWMFQPVVRALRKSSDGLDIRVISLCEFRGLETPVELFVQEGAHPEKVIPMSFRRGSAGSQKGTVASALGRRLARKASWSLLLRKRLEATLDARPDLVVLPNDAAFPYDRICELLTRRAIPFVLVQEGIRFPLPNAEGDEYGKHGAAAIAAWGEKSADFFVRQGVPSERIHVTGSPRFDTVWQTDWYGKSRELRKQLDLNGSRVLALFTNPIDDQGFCTTQGKMALIRRFVAQLAPLFNDPEFVLIIKLHGRESKDAYDLICRDSPHRERIRVLQGGFSYPLFSVAEASLVFASSVGLEALLFDCPLGVLEIPGHGFAHDYVDSGAAIGVNWAASDMQEEIELLMDSDSRRSEISTQYVRCNLAFLGAATDRVTELILRQLN